jgi:hypothetical protein
MVSVVYGRHNAQSVCSEMACLLPSDHEVGCCILLWENWHAVGLGCWK